jgi:hypothetical protein
MDTLKEATKFLNDKNCVWDQPSLHRIISGLVQIITTERRRHAEDLRDIQRQLEE